MKQQLKEYIQPFPKENVFAITLTMKQHSKGQRLDKIRASKNLRYFLNRLNRVFFRSSARRYNKRVNVIPVLEKSYSGRLHYHLTIENPLPDEPFYFEQSIKEQWQKTDFGDAQVDIKIASDVDRWNQYIMKAKTPDIDWANYSNQKVQTNIN